MTFKKFISASLLSVALVFNSYASEIPSKEQVEKVLKPIIPNGKVVEVNETPIQNIYEIVVEVNNRYYPFYIDKSLKYLISGPVVDIEGRRNLTQERAQELQRRASREKFAQLSQLLGVKKAEKLLTILSQRDYRIVDMPEVPKNVIVEGNPYGSKVVYVITDPECPFCKRFNDEIKKLVQMDRSVKVVEILYPLPFHSYAKGVSSAVLCQSNKDKAKKLLNKAFDYQQDKTVLGEIAQKSCQTGNEILKSHKEFAEKVGLRGTPSIIIPLKNGKALFISGGFDAKTLKRLLDIIYQ